MKILLSPAKSLNLDDEIPHNKYSKALFLNQSKELHNILNQKSAKDIEDLMNLSPKLAQLNWERYQTWDETHTIENSRPSLYCFNGDVYNGIKAYNLDTKAIDFLQKELRILSGLYGMLKPLDLIQAYRLEMGTKLENPEGHNLYAFWKETLSNELKKELANNEIIINLASKEYSKAIDLKKLEKQHRVIEPIFKDFKNGKLKVISLYAKRARGEMVRSLSESRPDNIDSFIRNYQTSGYYYSERESTSTDQPVFVKMNS